MIITGIILLVLRSTSGEVSHFSPGNIALVIAMALCTIAAYLFFELSMRKGDLVLVTSASYLIPVSASLVSGLFLGTPPGIRFFLGALTVAFAAWICRKSFK